MMPKTWMNLGKDVLLPVSPLQVAAYLHARGWQQVSVDRDRAATWTLPARDGSEEDYFEALLPLRTDFSDYPLRIADLLGVLAEAEVRAPQDVLESVAATNSDILKLRLLGDNASAGSIPLAESVRLFQRGWDIMQAAACAAVSPRAAYSTRKPDRVREYMESVRAGQTRPGSYIISIISPVPPNLFSASGSEVVEPFERRVLRVLLGGLHAALTAASAAAAGSSEEPFDGAVARGVSANLCEGIADLVEVGGSGFEATCEWSLSRQPPDDVPHRVVAERGVAPYMRAAAASFRANNPIEDAEARGFVEKVSRSKGANRGKITIVGSVGDQPRRVEAWLQGDVYLRAVTAHKEEMPVICYGLLEREGRGYILKNPWGFEVVE